MGGRHIDWSSFVRGVDGGGTNELETSRLLDDHGNAGVFRGKRGCVAELIRVPATIEGMEALGYPAYFVTIIGVWKVLGSVALLAPGFPRLKEWAYAGIFFNMTGACASHIAA